MVQKISRDASSSAMEVTRKTPQFNDKSRKAVDTVNGALLGFAIIVIFFPNILTGKFELTTYTDVVQVAGFFFFF